MVRAFSAFPSRFERKEKKDHFVKNLPPVKKLMIETFLEGMKEEVLNKFELECRDMSW